MRARRGALALGMPLAPAVRMVRNINIALVGLAVSVACSSVQRSAEPVRAPRAVSLATTISHAEIRAETPTAHVVLVDAATAPAVFVLVDAATGTASDARTKLTAAVKRDIERIGYATSWPGGSPSAAALRSSGAHAFVVAPAVTKLEIGRAGSTTHIACSITMRVARWSGTDGAEHWEPGRAAFANASATTTTSNRERDIQLGSAHCVEAAAGELSSRHVLPFLRSALRIAAVH